MHAILVTVGTDGDVFPYVGLGAALRRRGHRATLATVSRYQPLATSHGLEFSTLVSTEEMDQALANPDFWHPTKSGRLLARWGVRQIERQYGLLYPFADDPEAVLIASPAIFAATLVHEKRGTPLASVLLQPGMIPSEIAPPVTPGFAIPRWTPRLIARLFWRFLDIIGYVLVSRHLNPIRISLGLPPVRRLFTTWLSPQLVLGMFPDWYGPPQRDWPPQIRLTGFPLFDGGVKRDLAPDLKDWCRAADPPIAFTFGTGMLHAARFFHEATTACWELNRRGIFLTRHKEQLPSPPPPFVRHCDFAPFRQLFPECAGVVHHGGIGTVASALASGTPQLVIPFAYDQFDNAVRVKRLRCGDWLKTKHATGERMAKKLKRLLTPKARQPCLEVAARFQAPNGVETAANLIEQFALEGNPAHAGSLPKTP